MILAPSYEAIVESLEALHIKYAVLLWMQSLPVAGRLTQRGTRPERHLSVMFRLHFCGCSHVLTKSDAVLFTRK